ncbi:glycoside hydrolase family 3 C-terminal domain-containing protein [candidate division KSB1 bacterium]
MKVNKHLIKLSFSVCIICLIQTMIFGQNEKEAPLYLKPEASIEKRVEDLLSRMTLEEKVGQLNMPNFYRIGKESGEEFEAGKMLVEGTMFKNIGPCGGFKGVGKNIKDKVEYYNKLQKIAVGKTRLKIPLIIIDEGTHGITCTGATVFPEGLAMGSTWNLNLINKIYAAVAKESRAAGSHMLCTLVIEPNRDPRMGRNEEGYSEDPFLCSCIAEAIAKGMQGEDISADDKAIAIFTCFPGQSQPVAGLERGAMEISERMLREVFLPPWIKGIKKGGALGVMATYPAIDGIPAHASERILTQILRNELGFKGIVLGEGQGLATMIDECVVENQKQAGELAIKAGVDVNIWFEEGFLEPLVENVYEGKVSEATINRAVRRVLRLKFQLGLFENLYVDVNRALEIANNQKHQKLALYSAREGIVLLKNENNLLPLDKNLKSITVIGPSADHERNLLGDYTAKQVTQDVITVLEGIKNKVSPETKITYVKGCNTWGTDVNEISEAKKAAKNADVAIVVVGENDRFKPGKGSDGEGCDIASLDLTGLQQDLIKAVFETGTPTIVVLINGRPLSIRWTAKHIPAIVDAWRCGEKGGQAVADVLFGDYNPSGKLPITIPRHVGQLPVFYNCKPPRAKVMRDEYWFKSYVDISPLPLFSFGHGLSYTKFEYSDLEISPKETGPYGEVNINCNIRNIGSRKGEEVVQLYINDVISSVVTPVIELKGFKKIPLKPGETKKVEFILTHEDLSFLDKHLEPVVEPGIFEIMVGASSQDIRLRGTFKVIK